MAILNTSRPRKFKGGGSGLLDFNNYEPGWWYAQVSNPTKYASTGNTTLPSGTSNLKTEETKAEDEGYVPLPSVYSPGSSFGGRLTEESTLPGQDIIDSYTKRWQDQVNSLPLTPEEKQSALAGTYASILPYVYNSQLSGDGLPDTERGPIRGAGLIVPALRGLGYGLGYKNLKKTYNAAKDYKIRTPIMEAEIAPVMPIRGLGRTDVDAAEQAMAPTSPKYSDMTANIIADQMNNQNKMGMANNYAKFASDFLQKERERYSTQIRENAKATIKAMNTNMKAATDNANQYDKEMADLKARYLTGKGIQTNKMLSDIAKKIVEKGQYDYESRLKEQQMGRKILNDKIAAAQDAIDRGIDVAGNEHVLKGLYNDLATGNYRKHIGEYGLPSWFDVLGSGITGNNFARKK